MVTPKVRTSGGSWACDLVLSHLGKDQVCVRVGLDVEVDEYPREAVTGIHRIHIVHVVHAADLLLDRRGHGLFKSFCVGTLVARSNLNLRGNDFGELCYG